MGRKPLNMRERKNGTGYFSIIRGRPRFPLERNANPHLKFIQGEAWSRKVPEGRDQSVARVGDRSNDHVSATTSRWLYGDTGTGRSSLQKLTGRDDARWFSALSEETSLSLSPFLRRSEEDESWAGERARQHGFLVTLLEFRLLTTPCHFLSLLDLRGGHA